MNRSIDPNAALNVCQRCGGTRPTAEGPAREIKRPCQCWDPLVEWLMERSDQRN